LMAVSMFAVMPRARLFLTVGLFVLAAIHVYYESRSLAAITGVVALYCLVTTFSARHSPAELKVQTLAAMLISIVMLVYSGPMILNGLAQSKVLPETLITKNQLQASNTYGFLAAARPDTFTALYAISKKPILGYGSGVFDPEVFSFYAEVNAASYRDAQMSRRIYKSIFQEDWALGIPSHSHIFGAWADSGIFGAVSWLFLMWLCLKILAQSWRWGHPFAPLFIFVGLETLWDVLFSPGPIRLDIAIRVVIIATALRYIDLSHLVENMQKLAAKKGD
jgi:O-antigen ligase